MQNLLKPLTIFFFLILMLLFTVSAFGQGTTGSLEGTVRDPNGAPVTGARVQLKIDSGANAPGFDKSATTDEKGYFFMAEIPAGKYRFLVSAQYYKTYADYVEIFADKATIATNVELCVGSCDPSFDDYEEDSDEALTPEIRASNKSETLGKLPSRTGFTSLLKIAPFVRPEPLAGGFSIDGVSGADNTFFIDGQEVTNFRSGLLPQNYDLPFGLVQEVQVRSEAIGAEYSGALGGVVSVVTKGGNNQWRGNFGVVFVPAGLQGSPRPILNRFGAAAGSFEYFEPQKDGGTDYFPIASLGGRIIKDKLWFFAAYAPQIYDRTRAIDYFTSANPATRTVNETIRYESNVRSEFAYLRLDAQPVSSVKMFGAFLYNPIVQDGALPGFSESFGGVPQSFGSLRGADFLATRGGRQNSNLVNGQISWDVTKNFLLNFRGGRGFLNEKLDSYGIPRTTRFLCSTGGTPQNVPGSNCSPGFQNISNNSVRDYEVSERTTFDAEAVLSGIGFFGRHNFRFGYQYNRLFNKISEGYADTGIVQLLYGVPISSVIGLPATPENLGSGFLQRFGTVGSASNTNQALYAQDAWRIKERLTLNFGIRFENENIPDYGTNRAPEFNWSDKIAPRFGFALDTFGNGKTKLFGSYGWFYDRFKYNASQQQFPLVFYRDYFEILPSRGAAYSNYTLPLILGNNVDDPAGNCPIVNSTGYSICQVSFNVPTNLPVFPFSLPLFADDLKPARSRELTIGVEQKLGAGFLLSGRYINRRLDNAIEDIGTFNDQGSELYTIGNPGEGAICALATDGNLPCAKAERRYDAFEIIVDKRARNYFFNASYTFSRLFGNYSGLASSDEFGLVSPNQTNYFNLPSGGFNADGDADNGRLATDRPHVFKAYGGYSFNWFGNDTNRTSVAAFTTIQSGTPMTTVYSLYGLTNSVLYERGDLGRTEIFSETDLRVGHRYKFGRDKRFALEPFVVFLNLFDERNELNRQTSISLTNFTAATLTQGGCTNCTSQPAVYNRLFNGGIRQFVQNYLNARPIGATGTRNDYNLPIAFQPPRSVRLGVRFIF